MVFGRPATALYYLGRGEHCAKDRAPRLKGRLVNSSIDAYVLSLETINRLSVQYRVEAFVSLVVNAWELLLKARIIHVAGDNDAIFFPKERGQLRRSHDIGRCIREVYPAENDPKRRNLEFVVKERNKAVHLVVDRLPKDILATFQACVINYHEELLDWFGISLSDRVPVGLMNLVYDLGPENFDLANKALRRRLGTDAVTYLADRQSEIRRSQMEIGYAKEFAAEVNLTVSVTNNPRGGDVVLTGGQGGRKIGVVDKVRDPAQTHPNRFRRVVTLINEALGGRHQITQYDVTCVAYSHSTETNRLHYFKSDIPGSFPQYSDAFVTWVVEQFDSDPNFFDYCRTIYRRDKHVHNRKSGQNLPQ